MTTRRTAFLTWVRRRRAAGDEEGMTLIFVVLVTSLVMIMVATSVGLSAANVKPSRDSADRQSALAAAQAGIDSFQAALNKCGPVLTACAGIAEGTRPLVGADGVTVGSYTWDVVSLPTQNNEGVLRLLSIGKVRDSQRTLVTDFRPAPSFLDYAYYSGQETVGPSTIATYYGPRTVQLPTTSIRAKATKLQAGKTSVTWTGAQNTDICNRPWYDSSAGPGRASLRATRVLPEGVDYLESTTGQTPAVQRQAPCEVALGSDVTINGMAYSKDAFYLTNAVSGGQGPMFADDVFTEWTSDKNPAPGTPGRWFRSNAQVGGAPKVGSFFPEFAKGNITMPSKISDLAQKATCVFTGPTRVQLVGTTAVVTSPGTTLASLPAACHPGSGLGSLSGPGLVQVQIPVTSSTVFYVKNGTDGGVATPTNPLFNLSGISLAGVATGQPAKFFSEMETDEATMRNVVATAPAGQLVHQTLDAWMATLNDIKFIKVNVPEYQTTHTSTQTDLPSSDDMFDGGAETATVQRRVCGLWVIGLGCVLPSSGWSDAFKVSRSRAKFPLATDVTPYRIGAGDVFVQGSVNGKMTIAADHDVVVTNSVSYATPDSILGLVAENDVAIYHPVACTTTTPVTAPGGTCPDDITGLFSGGFTASDMTNFHPSRRYTNLRPDLANLTVNAAALARNGSFLLQNYMRGVALGTLTVNGGVYQQHRGSTGVDWEAPSQTSERERSGYVTSITYDSRLSAHPPPYFVDPAEAMGTGAWEIVGIAQQQGGS
jgi:hypothetical protein